MSQRMNMVWAAVAASACTAVTQGSLLNLTLEPSPDITSGFIDVTYNAGTQQFAATGFALSMFDGVNNAITNGGFAITATIDNSGNALGGLLAITGNVGGFGMNLLTGNLQAFGFMPGGGDLFEFVFEVTGGDLAPAYGGVGSLFGVILNAVGSTFNGNWGQSFNNNGGIPGFGFGVSDTAPIPAPAALPLLAAIGLIARRRRS
ncbi:MAG TPA: hypothetical protein PK400_02445 [Phycisphaerales bacterium]|nr:hypothetical protein [Phycisphaerales bacterium]HRQ74560.1 hypothetical protein [Phycisphaerales bacterium]